MGRSGFVFTLSRNDHSPVHSFRISRHSDHLHGEPRYSGDYSISGPQHVALNSLQVLRERRVQTESIPRTTRLRIPVARRGSFFLLEIDRNTHFSLEISVFPREI